LKVSCNFFRITILKKPLDRCAYCYRAYALITTDLHSADRVSRKYGGCRKTMAKRSKKVKISRYRGFLPALIALALCGALLALIYMLPSPKSVSPSARPPFEDFSSHAMQETPPPVPRPAPHRAVQGPSLPLAAIIIDDMGYDYSMDEAFLQIHAPLSFAFLPFAPNTPKLAGKARALGRDVLVHLPLEPENGAIDPGPGVLRLDMDFNTTIETLKKDLDAVPGATGVNNHMGSKYTKNERAMKIVLTEIRRRHMFFVDSRTSAETKAYITARRMGIPAARRVVFLDHTEDQRAVRHEIARLIKEAGRRGSAVAIGHPLKVTLQVLYRELPRLMKKVKLVPVHQIVEQGPDISRQSEPGRNP